MPQSRKRHTARRTHTRGTSAAAQERAQARHAKQNRTRVIAAGVFVASCRRVATSSARLAGPGARRCDRSFSSTQPLVGAARSCRVSRGLHYTARAPTGRRSTARGQGSPTVRVGHGSVIKGCTGVATMKSAASAIRSPALRYGPSSTVNPNSTPLRPWNARREESVDHPRLQSLLGPRRMLTPSSRAWCPRQDYVADAVVRLELLRDVDSARELSDLGPQPAVAWMCRTRAALLRRGLTASPCGAASKCRSQY